MKTLMAALVTALLITLAPEDARAGDETATVLVVRHTGANVAMQQGRDVYYDEIAKTGLGSSATLVTSLVGALLQSFGLVDLEGDAATAVGQAGLETTHALAMRLLMLERVAHACTSMMA